MTIRGNNFNLNIEGNTYNFLASDIVSFSKKYAAFPTVSVTELGYTFYSQPSTNEPLQLFNIELIVDYATGTNLYADLKASVQSWKANNFRNVTVPSIVDLIIPEPIDGVVTKDTPQDTDLSGNWGYFEYDVVVLSFEAVHEGSDYLRVSFSAIEYLT